MPLAEMEGLVDVPRGGDDVGAAVLVETRVRVELEEEVGGVDCFV